MQGLRPAPNFRRMVISAEVRRGMGELGSLRKI